MGALLFGLLGCVGHRPQPSPLEDQQHKVHFELRSSHPFSEPIYRVFCSEGGGVILALGKHRATLFSTGPFEVLKTWEGRFFAGALTRDGSHVALGYKDSALVLVTPLASIEQPAHEIACEGGGCLDMAFVELDGQPLQLALSTDAVVQWGEIGAAHLRIGSLQGGWVCQPLTREGPIPLVAGGFMDPVRVVGEQSERTVWNTEHLITDADVGEGGRVLVNATSDEDAVLLVGAGDLTDVSEVPLDPPGGAFVHWVTDSLVVRRVENAVAVNALPSGREVSRLDIPGSGPLDYCSKSRVLVVVEVGFGVRVFELNR